MARVAGVAGLAGFAGVAGPFASAGIAVPTSRADANTKASIFLRIVVSSLYKLNFCRVHNFRVPLSLAITPF